MFIDILRTRGLTDLAGNLIAATPTSGATFTVDNTPPTVSIGAPSVTATRSGPVTYTVTYADASFNESTLSVSHITLNTTGTATASVEVSGTGTTRTITLTSITGDGSLGISIAAGTATDTAGNPAPAAGPSATFSVDNTGPAVSSVSTPANGSYKVEQTLDFTVALTKYTTVVTTGGRPALGLTIGAAARNASYLSGSGTSALLFRYTPVGGDTDTDGIAVASSMNLNGGTITDAMGNDASLSFTAPDTSAVLVDTTAPTAALTYSASVAKSGSTLTITAMFSEPLADAPGVKLAISAVPGGTALAATAMTKVDSTHYTYDYTVQGGNGTATVTLSVGTDLAGNVVTSTPTSGATFIVENTAPTAALTYAPGAARSGGAMTITARFSEPMADAPAPKLAISAVTGGTALAATSMTKVDSTTYTYVYAGQTGNGTATVSLSTGTDLAGNVVTATPASGATFTVDNTRPTIAVGAPSVTATRSGPVTYSVTYADANFSASTLSADDITLNTTGTATAAIAVTGTGTTRTVTLSSISGDGPLGISIAAGTATDTAGNPAPAAGPSATVAVDNTAPAITSVSAPANGSYKAGQNLDFTVAFSENATVVTAGGTPGIGLTIGAATRNASYVSGSGTSALLFRYTIAGGDNDAVIDVMVTSPHPAISIVSPGAFR